MAGMTGMARDAVSIETDGVRLDGERCVPAGANGMVLFAHGSGSSHRSPRNRYVAEVLQVAGMATLLVDLLAPEEDVDTVLRFDIALLSRRLQAVVAWSTDCAVGHTLPIGLFGASTGAAAALRVAADPDTPCRIDAVVSRGGRVDLAGEAALRRLKSPTLMIVGGADPAVLRMNREAAAWMACAWRLDVVPGATHLFAEPGALEDVARRAARWFAHYLARGRG